MSLRDVLIAGAAVAVASMTVSRCYGMRADEWQKRAAAAERVADVLREDARDAAQRAMLAEDRADSLARAAADRAPIIRQRIDAVRVQTPPELADHPAIVERDAIIDELATQSGRWREAYDLQLVAAQNLRHAYETAQRSADSLQAVLGDRPGPRPWWIPRLGVGPFVGVCTEPKPCAGLGVGLMWEIKL